MSNLIENLSLANAKRMLEAAESKVDEFGLAYNGVVVDAGGHLLAFSRQDNALVGCIDLAVNKFLTARIFDSTNEALAIAAQPTAPFFGIQHSNKGRWVIFGGGIPVVRNVAVIGVVGAGGGTLEQDIVVAAAAIGAVPG